MLKHINFGPQNALGGGGGALSPLCVSSTLITCKKSETHDEPILKNADFGPKNDPFSPFWV